VARTTDVARAAAGAGGVSLVICLLLFAIIEVRRAGTARREARVASRPVVPPPAAEHRIVAPSMNVDDLRAEGAPLGSR
jgi:hypothetical protein